MSGDYDQFQHPYGCRCLTCRPAYGFYQFTPTPGPWTCPKCSSIYGPAALECTRCNPPKEFTATSSQLAQNWKGIYPESVLTLGEWQAKAKGGCVTMVDNSDQRPTREETCRYCGETVYPAMGAQFQIGHEDWRQPTASASDN